MRIAVTADLHLPLNLKGFYDSLQGLGKIDLFIFAGDTVDRDNHLYFKKLYYILREKFGEVKIISVFGNNENPNNWEKYKKEYSFMGWLDNEYVKIDDIYFVGTSGFPDWRKSIVYSKKNLILSKLNDILSSIDGKVVFISHYSFCLETIKGDPGNIFGLYSREMEELVRRYLNKIILAFHGHAHFAKNWYHKLGNTEVYNVSFYIHKKPLVFEI